MELLLTVEEPESGRRTEVSADLDPFVPVATLAAALADWMRAPAGALLVVDGVALDPRVSVYDSGLVSGSTVALVEPLARHRFERGAGGGGGPLVSLDITSGPDAGRTVELAPGRYRIGRSPEADVRVDDPAVSWFHFRIEVAGDLSVTIEPNPDASNGTFVGAAELVEARSLEREETVLAGNTQMVLRGALFRTVGRRDRLGQVTFNPLPYRRPVVRARRLPDLPRPPERPGERRFPLIALAVPVVASVLIVWLTHLLTFLVLALLSPLMMISNHVSEGRSSRRNHRRDKEEFERRVRARAGEVSAALEDERRERLTAAPDVGFLARQAAGRLGRLWERPRSSPDFLELRLGLGTQASRVETPVEPGGDADLRDWADEQLAHHRTLSVVPVTVSLDRAAVSGVYGDADQVRALATALILQAVLLHSPEQLVLAAAVPAAELGSWSWLKWLPHTRSATSPLEGEHLVDEHQVDDLVARLGRVVADRAGSDRSAGHMWPRVLLVLHERAEANRAALAALLDAAPHVGIVCLWVGAQAALLPRQCSAVVQVARPDQADSVLTWTDPEVADQAFAAEGIDAVVADRIARSLAPVRDVSAPTVTTGIPRVVGLFDLPGCDPAGLAGRWARPRPYGLEATIGVGVDGPFTVDLVSEGPHALIAGTSGAGKSELLQTLVGSLAAGYPPDRLNFLFIDYKGGASSAPFAALPHTVGLVSNLDERLALRALTSLRAELQRRMSLLEGRAKDLDEMLKVAPADAPPSLVIVVDEFATLVKEIPDFMAGMVDVAQRGRSLGIHLVLATQRPTGSVNDNILANTNLRIALRVLDGADSTAVIGSRDAAGIPVPLRGRAYARTGPGALVPFQCAWSGAPYVAGEQEAPVLVRPFGLGGGRPPAAPDRRGGEDGPTQLSVLVDSAARVFRQTGRLLPRKPWVSPLPPVFPLGGAGTRRRDDAGRWVAVGLGDFPEEQRQSVVSVDLEAEGGLLVFGSGGSGKTTLLRTVAADLVGQGGPDQVTIYALDFSGRSLVQLEELPHVAAVATGDDLEKVTRMLTALQVELQRRRRLLADARVESVSALRAQDAGVSLPRIVLLLDSYAGFHSTFEAGTLYTWIEALIHLVTEGRQVGIHVVMTNSRVLGVPTAITSAVAARVVLRMATVDELISLGISRSAASGAELGPGRGFMAPSTELQVAVISDDPSGAAQAAAITDLAARSAGAPRAPALLGLPEVAKVASASAAVLRFPLGVADLTLDTVDVDLANHNLVVMGPPLSGRSTALHTAVAGLRAGTPGVQLVGIGSLTSPLASEHWDIAGFGRAHHLAAIQSAAGLVEGEEGDRVKVILVVDAAEDFEAMEYNVFLEPLVRSDAVRVLAACDTATLERAYSGWMTVLKRNRVALLLQPSSSAEVEEQTRVRPYLRPGQSFPPGRGVLVARGQATLIQVGYPAG